jgi:hypothetical protein
MFLNAPGILPASQLISYLNGFRVYASTGSLSVSRLFPHDDIDPRAVMIRSEPFRQHQAAEFAEEVEEVYHGLRDRFLKPGVLRPTAMPEIITSSWTVRPIDRSADHLMMRGPGGRSVEFLRRDDTLTLKVGFETMDPRHERDARMTLSITRDGGEPRLSSAYEIGFGNLTFHSLLRFLDVELREECLEFISRRRLWESLRNLFGRDGLHTDDYDGDHHGLAWKALDSQGEEIHGRVWTDDCYPSLHIAYPASLSPLTPSLLPLWNDTVERIRDFEKRPVRRPSARAQPVLQF